MAGVNVTNPHKKFQFKIELGLLDNFLAQEVEIPEMGAEVVTHGDINFDVKTAGRYTVGNLKVDKISSNSVDPLRVYLWERILAIQNPFIGGGEVPDDYKINGRIIEFANDGFTPRAYWEFEGAWPIKINGVPLSRTTSDNTIETVEFSIDKMYARL